MRENLSHEHNYIMCGYIKTTDSAVFPMLTSAV